MLLARLQASRAHRPPERLRPLPDCVDGLTISSIFGRTARATGSSRGVVEDMSPLLRRAAALSSLGAVGWLVLATLLPPAAAAPGTDDHGFLDSTARCVSPTSAVMFGSTETSRVAICKTADSQYEYRGVRVRDGAKLIASAKSADDGFVADNDGIVYTVDPESLVVSSGSTVIREESWTAFHGDGSSRAAATPSTSTTKPKPLPPPLRAEVGGSG